jgi:hypothetical protein
MSGRGQRPTSGSPAGATSETCDRNACAGRASRAGPSRGTTREELAGAQRTPSDAPPGLHRVRRARRDRGLPPQLLRPPGSFSQVLSAVVATALWPLVLLGADLHLSLAHV